MKQLIILLLAFFFFVGSIFASGDVKIQETEYWEGKVSQVSYQTVKGSDKIDLYFFKEHFYKPYCLPESFINTAYKDATFSVWGNRNPHTIENNWKNSYTYDNQSRLIRYTYSACLACSSMAYDYTVTYNAAGQIESISNSINMRDEYRLHYTESGDLQAIDFYSLGKLDSTLAVVR